MASITASTGAIDVNAIVTQLMSIEQQPIKQLDTKITAVQTKMSAVGRLQSAFSALQTASRALLDASTWSAASASTGDDTIVKATASSGAPPGNYAIDVTKLAQNQTVVSGQVATATTAVGSGMLHLQLGSTASGSFVADAAKPTVDISIAAGSSLADIRTAINNAGAGVSASLVNDGGQVRLMLRSTNSGVANSFRMTATDDDGVNTDATGLSSLAYDPAGGGSAMTLTQAGQDAEFTLGGLALKSPTNVVENVIDGVTLELRKAGSSTSMAITSDQAAIRAKVDSFVTAYNSLNSQLRDLTKYDASTKTAGTLQGNTVIVSAMGRLRDMLSTGVGASTLGTLSNAGIELQRDGSLQVNDTKFSAAAANPINLKALFSSSGTDTASTGIARRLDTAITDLLGVSGAITNETNSLNQRRKSIDDQKTRLTDRLTITEARLRKQYTDLDTKVSSITNAGSALIAQLSKL